MTTFLLLLLLLSIKCVLSIEPFFHWDYSLWTKHNQLRSNIATGTMFLTHNQPFATNMEQILYDKNLESIPLNHALKSKGNQLDHIGFQKKLDLNWH